MNENNIQYKDLASHAIYLLSHQSLLIQVVAVQLSLFIQKTWQKQILTSI